MNTFETPALAILLALDPEDPYKITAGRVIRRAEDAYPFMADVAIWTRMPTTKESEIVQSQLKRSSIGAEIVATLRVKGTL